MTRQILPIAVLLLVAVCGYGVSAQPDLIVADIGFVPATPIAGEMTTIVATLENIGSANTGQPFYVTFEVDGREVDVVMVARGLGAGRTAPTTVSWHAAAGTHVVRILVDDPFDRVAESDESNNNLTRTVHVALSNVATDALAPFKVAVARFDDLSGSPFINVGEGVADKLIERLIAVGIRVLERSELEAIMREHGLNPALSSDISIAGQLLGADLLIVGSVTDVDVQEVSFSLGFLSLNNAAVDVSVSARVVNVATSEILSAFSVEGYDEGSTGFSIDIGQVLGYLQATPTPTCIPGFLPQEAWYSIGESIPLSYQNPGASAWFGVEIYTATGTFLKWLGWEYIDIGDCGDWVWDQKSAAGFQMSPGIYTAKLWNGAAYVETVDFQIRPGFSLIIPPVDEITVGTEQFSETVVGTALDQALDQLTASILQSMEQLAPMLLVQKESLLGALDEAPAHERTGQIAAILPDGRLAINTGASDGITRGEFFEVLHVANVVVDPRTQEILAYDVLGVKGEIVVTEVRDLVSYAVPTSGFVAEIGDIVRRLVP